MNSLALALPTGRKSKKEIRKTIQEKLTATLVDYKPLLGDKKFESRIRKAARQLGADIAKSLPRKSKKTKKNVETAPE